MGRACAGMTASPSVTVPLDRQDGLTARWSTCGQVFWKPHGGGGTSLHLTESNVFLLERLLCQCKPPQHLWSESFLLYCLPLNIQGRKKLQSHHNSLVFMNSVNKEGLTSGKFQIIKKTFYLPRGLIGVDIFTTEFTDGSTTDWRRTWISQKSFVIAEFSKPGYNSHIDLFQSLVRLSPTWIWKVKLL